MENSNEGLNNLLKKRLNTLFFIMLKYDQFISHVNQLKNNFKKRNRMIINLKKIYDELKVSNVNK